MLTISGFLPYKPGALHSVASAPIKALMCFGYPLLQSRFQRDHQNGRRCEQKAFKPLQDYLTLKSESIPFERA
jgi:hypothetical protein